MTINNYYTQTPYNSPILSRIQEKPGHEADESESSEEIYASVHDKEPGQGPSAPVAVPQRKPIVVDKVWPDVYFGD